MQDMVTAGMNNTQARQDGFRWADGQRRFGLRSVTKIVKSLNTQHNSDALTFKTVSDWLTAEGYWAKDSGRLRPTEKGIQNGMSVQKGCLNGREFESVYCDSAMQSIISGRFNSFFEEKPALEENQAFAPQDKMATTWEELAKSYYEKGCFKEAADCYKNSLNCLRP